VDSTATGARCQATNKRGTPCQNPPRPGRPFCWWHDPQTQRERSAARVKGGLARHGREIGTTGDRDPVTIDSLGDVVALLTDEINAVRRLERSISRSRAIGYLAGILVTVYAQSELEARVTALETRQGTR